MHARTYNGNYISMIIATVNAKGGVGKSTIAVHLTLWLHEQGIPVVLVDVDTQQSSSRWIRGAAPTIQTFSLQSADTILEDIPRLDTEFQVVVADGPAGLAEETRALMLVADLAIVPCGPSALDIEASGQAVRILKQARTVRKDGKPDAICVLNKTQTNTRLSNELVAEADSLGIPVARTALHLRQAYADVPGQRTAVWHLGYRGRDATTEILQLFQEVTPYGRTAETDSRAC